MFKRSVSVGPTIIVGVSSAVLVALILLIGVVRAAPEESAGHALPAAGLRASAPVVIAGANQAVDVIEVGGQPETSTTPAADVNSRLSVAIGTEPARRMREEPSVTIDRLVLVGDSLADATAQVIEYVTPGKLFVRKFFGGTAPCDWIESDLEATPDTVVVITFTGNNMTPCMLDAGGARLTDQALVDKYRVDVRVLIDHAATAGAWVVLVGQPLHHPRFDADLEVEGINAAYREFADAMPRVSYVDAGHSVETPDGRYADRLPCIDLDIDCASDGSTVVRGDGVHFCPIIDVSPCPVWSGGAVRFGLAIASAANDPVSFD